MISRTCLILIIQKEFVESTNDSEGNPQIELSLKKMIYLLRGVIEAIIRDSTETRKGI